MPYSYVWIIAQDMNGLEIAKASVMESNNCLGTTGGDRPLPLDPRVYYIHVEYEGRRSDAKKLVLEANSEVDAQREVFILKEPASEIA